MQVNLLPAMGPRPKEGDTGALVLAPMLPLLEMNAGPRTRREQASADRAERMRRRNTEHQQTLAHVSETPRTSEQIVRAERKMLSGSQAAHNRQTELRQRQGARREESGFREALAGARRCPAEGKPSAGTTEPVSRAAGQSMDRPGLMDAARAAGDATKPDGAGATRLPSPLTGPVPPTPSAVNALGGRSASVTPASAGNADAIGSGNALKAAAATARLAATSAVTRGGGGSPRGANSTGGNTAPAGSTGTRSAGSGRGVPRGAQTAGEPDAERAADANTERILRTIHFRLGERRSAATLRLDPPELGKIKLHVDLRDERLSLRIEADSPAARRLLTEQLDALRHGLEASGIQLERFEIRAPHAAPGDGNANLPQHEDVPYGGQHESAQRDAHSAGGGSPGGTEAPTVEPAREPEPGQTVLEPATESRVNVWA